MPDMENGRKKVLEYIENNDISFVDLAVAYGIKNQDLTNYLNGNLKTAKGNKIILKIISDHKIR